MDTALTLAPAALHSAARMTISRTSQIPNQILSRPSGGLHERWRWLGQLTGQGSGHQVDFSWDKINPRALEATDCGGIL